MSNRIVSTALICLVTLALPLSTQPAPAQSNVHIVAVPQPISVDERAAAEARDRRWVARCRPVIRQDEYGVPRYVYAARGCEYGRLD